MKRSPAVMVLRWSGRVLVAAILLFVLLPGIVVAVTAFNDRAILGVSAAGMVAALVLAGISPTVIFGRGFWNGLTVTLWASSIALVVGAAFAIAIHRYTFVLKSVLEGILLSPLIIPHYTIGLGVLILASQTGAGRGFPLVILTHVLLVLPFVMRSTFISLENLDSRLELRSFQPRRHTGPYLADRDDPAAAAGAVERLAVCRDPRRSMSLRPHCSSAARRRRRCRLRCTIMCASSPIRRWLRCR